MMAGPRWDGAVSGTSPLSSSKYPSFWVSVTKRLIRQASTSIGKQYELNSIQTGEFHPTMDNRDAAFSPVNTSSPYSPQVAPFTPFRLRAQYPATPNILTTDQATSGSLLAAGQNVDPVVPAWFSYFSFWTIKAESDAYTGPNVFQQFVGAAQTPPFAAADMNGWSVVPGAQHSAQCVMRATAGGTTPQARLVLLWRDVNGGTISTVVGGTVTLTANSRVWQQITVSGQAPANAAGASLQIQMVNSVAVTWQASGFQIEYAAAPTAWATPGTWYPVFYGGTERWPQKYDMGGTFGQTEPVVVDAFALLAGIYPLPAFYNDVLALSPDFFFPLDDPTGSTVFRDLAGKNNPAPVSVSPYGSGTVAAGSSVQSTSAGGTFLGAPGGVVTMTNLAGGATSYQPCSFIELNKVGIFGPPVTGGWTRMVAFRNNGAGPAGNSGTLWQATNPSYAGPQNFFGIFFGDGVNSGLTFQVAGPSASTTYSPPVGTWADGNWHLMVVTSSTDQKTITVYIDGTSVRTNTTATSQTPITVGADTVGAQFYPGVSQYFGGYNGDAAHVAQWPSTLSSGQVTNLYTSWRSAWQGETSGQRYSRILVYAGYPGQTNIATGATTAIGPATDIDGKTDALTLLQNVVVTENGVHYASPAAPITFEARTNRYGKLTPTYTFGENVIGGEWPYEDVAFDYDTTHVIGQAQITQNSTGQVFVANSPVTVAPNYRPTYQRTINVVNPQECVDAANYLANRYASAHLRVQKVRLHPAGVSGMWPVALALQISMRVRVMRRSPGAPAIQFDGFIESLKWAIDWDTGEAFLDLEISPADLQQYWVNAALRTTLFSQATAAGSTAVVSPLPDSATNSFGMSVCSGLQLTLEPGTVRAETLTVLSVSATVPGYTSCTVTFTAPLAFTHPINSTVCEALPAGVTDPSTWDAAAICGVTTTPSY